MSDETYHSSRLPKFGQDTTDFHLWHFKLLGEAFAKDADIAFENDLPPEPKLQAATPGAPTTQESQVYNQVMTSYRTDNKELLKATKKAKGLLLSSLSDGNLRLISHLKSPKAMLDRLKSQHNAISTLDIA